MPGKQKLEYGGLELEVKPIGGEREFYFTDESPKFVLRIHNLIGKRVRGALTWFYGFGSGGVEHTTSGDVDFDLNPGETAEKEIMGRLLGFQGNGVIGIPTPLKIESENSKERVLGPTPFKLRYFTLYTFTIMDKGFYNRVYEHPMKTQNRLLKSQNRLTIILIILTVIYVAQALGLIPP